MPRIDTCSVVEIGTYLLSLKDSMEFSECSCIVFALLLHDMFSTWLLLEQDSFLPHLNLT